MMTLSFTLKLSTIIGDIDIIFIYLYTLDVKGNYIHSFLSLHLQLLLVHNDVDNSKLRMISSG